MNRLPLLLLLALLFAGVSLFAQPDDDLMDDEDSEAAGPIRIGQLVLEPLRLPAGAPPVGLAFTPLSGGALAYFPMPGWTADSPAMAQVSVGMTVVNQGKKPLAWDHVEYVYTIDGETVTRTFIPIQSQHAAALRIPPGEAAYWQNTRDYHVDGEVLYFSGQVPETLTIRIFFQKYPKPVEVTKRLVPYPARFALPFKAEDLLPGEFWTSGATHGGKDQVFAYDMTVTGYNGRRWSGRLPGTDGSRNEDIRSYGKPIYAIADGEVVSFANDNPDNPKPGVKAGTPSNTLVIRSGKHTVMYQHLKPGSISPELLRVGAKVKEGQLLAQTGNSGRSSGPHLHISLRDEQGNGLPLLFKNGYVIGKSLLPSPDAPARWSPLSGRGIPGRGKEKSYIWPGKELP